MDLPECEQYGKVGDEKKENQGYKFELRDNIYETLKNLSNPRQNLNNNSPEK